MRASIVLDAVVRWGEPFDVSDERRFADLSRCFVVRASGFAFSMFAGDGEIPHVVDVARDGVSCVPSEDIALVDGAASDRRLATFADSVHLPVIDGGR
jgi:hypothetical protein